MMHLTNYAVNKRNPNFIQNENEADDDKGHKRSFTSIMKVDYIFLVSGITIYLSLVPLQLGSRYIQGLLSNAADHH